MLKDMPKIGFGTWERFGDEGYATTLAALEAGYRHIDTAEGYGNEAAVGRGIAESGVARGDIWITTKVAPEHLGPGQVRSHAEASLEKLGVDQVDLFLVHWPSIGDDFDIADYMAQMLAVRDAGLCRHIGVSNFTIRHIDAALAAMGDVPILTNQVELHPFLANRAIVDHCATKGIRMTAYCPLARGKVMADDTLAAIAGAHGLTAAQVALAWLLAKSYTVIPSSSNPNRIAQNLAAGDVVLSDEEIARIDALDRGERLVNGTWSPVWDV